MSGRIRYTEEFKREAVAQVTDRGYSVRDVAKRLGVSTKSIYDWSKLYGSSEPDRGIADEQQAENRRLKAELARVTEERDILKLAGKDIDPGNQYSGVTPPRTLPARPSEVRLYKGA